MINKILLIKIGMALFFLISIILMIIGSLIFISWLNIIFFGLLIYLSQNKKLSNQKKVFYVSILVIIFIISVFIPFSLSRVGNKHNEIVNCKCIGIKMSRPLSYTFGTPWTYCIGFTKDCTCYIYERKDDYQKLMDKIEIPCNHIKLSPNTKNFRYKKFDNECTLWAKTIIPDTLFFEREKDNHFAFNEKITMNPSNKWKDGTIIPIENNELKPISDYYNMGYLNDELFYKKEIYSENGDIIGYNEFNVTLFLEILEFGYQFKVVGHVFSKCENSNEIDENLLIVGKSYDKESNLTYNGILIDGKNESISSRNCGDVGGFIERLEIPCGANYYVYNVRYKDVEEGYKCCLPNRAKCSNQEGYKFAKYDEGCGENYSRIVSSFNDIPEGYICCIPKK
jgi:hypothetical protein